MFVKGFTLIELMIVTAIIAILAAIAIPAYNNYVMEACNADQVKCKRDMPDRYKKLHEWLAERPNDRDVVQPDRSINNSAPTSDHSEEQTAVLKQINGALHACVNDDCYKVSQ